MTIQEVIEAGTWRGGNYGHPDSKEWQAVIPNFYGTHDCDSAGCVITPIPVGEAFENRLELIIYYAKR